MTERATMALFDVGYRLPLRGGYFLQKQDDDTWQVGGDAAGGTGEQVLLGFQITSNVPVGRGGSMDGEIKRLADAVGPTGRD